ncbi:MAG: hypothetical protein ACREJ9_02760 [Candidatus Rokuibacteriota bacterium]
MDRGDLAEGLVRRLPAGRAGARPSSRRLLSFVVLTLACLAWLAPARAGHEMPFYPSYYPQEITVETMTPAAAAAGFEKDTVHAYLGPDPYAGKPLPARVTAFESLGSYVLVTLNRTAPSLRDVEARCAAARRIVGGLAPAGWTFHPYPVTPYHPDYLHHVDVADAAVRRFPRAAAPGLPSGLRVRARGRLAQAFTGAPAPGPEPSWDALVEEVSVRDLVAGESATLHGGLAAPWIKEGWLHAWLLLAGGLADRTQRAQAGETFQRLTAGGAAGTVERLNLERALVGHLTAGCERVIAGYTVHREIANTEYSAGVENVAADAATGFNSAIFIRTVKLKDFPWNGWLTLGVAAPAAAAWNPVAGFTDATGRLMWAALGDAALIPEPSGASWVENRVRLQTTETVPPMPVRVPRDALRPEPGTGLFKEAGDGKTARAKLTYRVLTSAYHDGTLMTAADALYALAFAFKWGAGQGAEQEGEVRRATTLMRQALVGVKVVRTDTDVLRFGEVTMKYDVPVIDVYLDLALRDPLHLAVVSPPWSPVPWHAVALMEEAVRRGLAAFSAEEARRRGLPWLDVVRDARLRDKLLPLVAELENQGYVPEALRAWVTPRQARERWGKLGQFAAERRHLLVTNGPYMLHAWSATGAVLRVFRDFTYPLGVGSFNRYPLPLRGFINRATVTADRIEVLGEAERVERFAREHRIVAEPVGSPGVQKERGAIAMCRYVVVGADGGVVKAGAVPPNEQGTFVVSRRGWPPAPQMVLLAISVNGNVVDPHARAVPLD